ncbi:hypothetical protein ACFYXC_19585 [Streptomyces sp. NPDC002701]|uniref:hypothetical protein n=1 Tax=Streptomyces sp. NPDC002701 TaxID=3364661 RepID=UPI00369531E9
MALAATFVTFTDVLWQDILLNLAFIAAVPGLGTWIVWGVRERRRGVRGALEHEWKRGQPSTLRGWKPRNRWIGAWISLGATAILLVFGAVLRVIDPGDDEALGVLAIGGIYAVVWAVALPLCRPLPGPRPEHATQGPPDESR